MELDYHVWRLIPGHSNVYYYGSASALVPLGGENVSSVDILLDSITLSAEAEVANSNHFTITGYAIESSAVESGFSPSALFDMF